MKYVYWQKNLKDWKALKTGEEVEIDLAKWGEMEGAKKGQEATDFLSKNPALTKTKEKREV